MLYRSTVEGYAKFAPKDSKWTKHTVAEHISLGGNGPLLVGTPTQVADELETWVNEADVDGFNFVSSDVGRHDQRGTVLTPQQAYVLFPNSFKDIIELLLPELKARGLFWDGYSVQGGTYRENFYSSPGQKVPLSEHIASRYHWRSGVPASEHEIPDSVEQCCRSIA